jgi:hypothetical protein
VIVVGEAANTDGVFVETFSHTGVPTPQGFHLAVTCNVAKSPACDTWAVVNPDGSLARSGCPGATSGGSGGGYDVMFTVDVSSCAFQATIGSSGDADAVPAGFVTVVGEESQSDGVFVETFDSAGTETPEGFHLAVTCGEAKQPSCNTWAVVNKGTALARTGCAGTTSGKAGPSGSYFVIFTKSVLNCAYEATLGLSTQVGEQPPGFVDVVGLGASDDGVFVQTFNAAGKPMKERFHLSVTC